MRKYGVRPKKKLGQTFLTDILIAKKIVEAANLSETDRVLEIGGGLGILTRWLVDKAQKVHVIEIERGLVKALRNIFKDHKNIDIIHGDALRVPLPEVEKVVSNLPYRISADITFRLINETKFKLAVLMYQREFSDRLLAQPGSQNYSRLTLGIRYLVDVEHVLEVPAEKFYPIPAVDSTVVKMWPRTEGPFARDKTVFYWMIQGIYVYPNKQIRKAVRFWYRSLGMEKSQADKLLNRCSDFLEGTERLRNLPLSVLVKMADEVLEMIEEDGVLPDPRREKQWNKFSLT